jgi:hypothetical protein
MRSLKECWVIVEGCKMVPDKIYVLKYLNRNHYKEYIFEFDSVCMFDGCTRIYHRNKWICDGDIHVCNSTFVEFVECLVTLPCGEDIKLSRYRKNIDWDNI